MSRLEQLVKMLKEDPKDSFLIFAIAKEYEKTNNLTEAINQYELLKKKDPNYVGLYYHLAHLYAETDQIERAMKVYDEGIVIAKRTSDFHALSELVNAKKNVEMESL